MADRRHYVLADGDLIATEDRPPKAADAYAYAGPSKLGFPGDDKEPAAPTIVLVLRAGIAGEFADYMRRWDEAWDALGIYSDQRLYNGVGLARIIEQAHLDATGEKPFHMLTEDDHRARREAADTAERIRRG